MSSSKQPFLGHKMRRFRRELGLSQQEMADELEISASYLSLIEHNQRPVTVPLLFKLGQAFQVDLRDFAEDDQARLGTALKEVFSDPVFDGEGPRDTDIRELAAASPAAAEAVILLYQRYRDLREESVSLEQQTGTRDGEGRGGLRLSPVEEVRDFLQAQSNHFPALEEAAEALWEAADLDPDALFQSLTDHLREVHGVGVRVVPHDVLDETLRRFDFHRRRVLISELLPLPGRTFQLAAQLAALAYREPIEALVDEAGLSGEEARRLAFTTLAGYFAGAVMMPYERFLAAAGEQRYDLDILKARFNASFEQVCHRLTTLQRQGARGVPFFFVRVDHAGNVSKRLSGAGFEFARFGGTCPRWVIYEAFLNPDRIMTQIAETPDKHRFLTIARTVDSVRLGHGHRPPHLAVAVGCDLRHAAQVVYADGMEQPAQHATPIGTACRVCDRFDCTWRAHPPVSTRLRVDDNIRRITPFSFS